MKTEAAPRLICGECGRANEPERIYCHDCGARLDHSTLPRAEASNETPDQVHERVSGMFDGRADRTRALVLKTAKLLTAAALAAVVLLMLLPPELPAVKKSETLPPQINFDLEMMTQSHRPPALRYSEQDVNAYVGYVLGRKESLNHPLLKFERALVHLHPATCELTVGRSILGYSIYAEGNWLAQLENGALRLQPTGGQIGRLPLHPALMRYGAFLFSDVAAALERERKLLAHVKAMSIGDKEVTFAAH